MKATGIVRRVDVLGRVVVPKEIRKILNIDEGDPIEIFTEKDSIVLKKYSPLSNMDGLLDDVCKALLRTTGKSVIITDKNTVLAVSGNGLKDVIGQSLSKELNSLILNRQAFSSAFEDGGMPIETVSGQTFDFCNQLIMPILRDEEGVGAVILGDKSKENKISASDVELISLTCEILSNRYR